MISMSIIDIYNDAIAHFSNSRERFEYRSGYSNSYYGNKFYPIPETNHSVAVFRRDNGVKTYITSKIKDSTMTLSVREGVGMNTHYVNHNGVIHRQEFEFWNVIGSPFIVFFDMKNAFNKVSCIENFERLGWGIEESRIRDDPILKQCTPINVDEFRIAFYHTIDKCIVTSLNKGFDRGKIFVDDGMFAFRSRKFAMIFLSTLHQKLAELGIEFNRSKTIIMNYEERNVYESEFYDLVGNKYNCLPERAKYLNKVVFKRQNLSVLGITKIGESALVIDGENNGYDAETTRAVVYTRREGKLSIE